MARRVFFSFHYQRDVWRANVVRKSGEFIGTAAAGFQDASLWEEAKRKGDAAIKKLIDDNLDGTTVTCVLIGAESWVRIARTSPRRGGGWRTSRGSCGGEGLVSRRKTTRRARRGSPYGPSNRVPPRRPRCEGKLVNLGNLA